MIIAKTSGLRAALLATSVLGLAAAPHAFAQDAAKDASAADAPSAEIVVKLNKTTRSSVELGGGELQKILPGINPLKAIQTLPGVLFETADPWGNNEQNETLFVHGFSLQQLGYTFDDVPLGDQQYGNWNGLSPSRAVISENVGRVQFASGAAGLGVASTSNLGGAIETFSSDPTKAFGFTAAETLGSYETNRTFLRVDTGDFGGGNSLYVALLHHDAKAWDFNAHQRDDQLNTKYVHTGEKGRLTAYLDYQKKVEPNEDSLVHPQTGTSATPATQDLNVPYTRPFLYPDYNAGIAYLLCTTTCAPPAADGNNFRNYHSAAQREDVLSYVKYDYKLNDNMSWSNQGYYHYNYGRGIVAGPINQAGLPALFAVYYPGPAGESATDQALRLKNVFGGTGYAVRTTEYLINRSGLISTFKWHLGDHDIEAGLWYEKEFATQHRAWYPFSIANNDLSPYDIPVGKNFNQYYGRFNDSVLNFHVQDRWHISPTLTLQYGFKSSSQTGKGFFPVNQQNAATGTQTHYPEGTIKTDEGFLPQVGLTWDATPNDQIFVDAQKNVRHFIVYGAGGSAWSLPSQAAFDLFKANTKPETSATYEAGWRFHHTFDGPITGFEGQVSAYHVDFQNRLLQVSSTPVILSLVAGAAVIANVGDVKTDGVDLAGTVHFGKHWSVYDALSYNKSVYQDNYTTGASSTVVPTAGKQVPASPDWMNKFILSANYGPFDMQISGDYVGKRYATYTNDLSIKGYSLTGLQMGYRFELPSSSPVKYAKLSLNITNLGDIKTTSTLVVGAASGTYNTYPMAPRMTFVTLTTKF